MTEINVTIPSVEKSLTSILPKDIEIFKPKHLADATASVVMNTVVKKVFAAAPLSREHKLYRDRFVFESFSFMGYKIWTTRDCCKFRVLHLSYNDTEIVRHSTKPEAAFPTDLLTHDIDIISKLAKDIASGEMLAALKKAVTLAEAVEAAEVMAYAERIEVERKIIAALEQEPNEPMSLV